MSNAAHLLPARLQAAAAAIANARGMRRGAPTISNILDALPQKLFAEVVEDAQAALDAADAAAPEKPVERAAPQDFRVSLAAFAALDLRAVALVMLDVQRDGSVHVSTWAQGSGTPSRALAEWGQGLGKNLPVIPFRTVFGCGTGGRPTPLTAAERDQLVGPGLAYAERNSVDPAREPPIPLSADDAERLGQALGLGSIAILHRDAASRPRAALWASGAEPSLFEAATAARLWAAVTRVLGPSTPDAADSTHAPEVSP